GGAGIGVRGRTAQIQRARASLGEPAGAADRTAHRRGAGIGGEGEETSVAADVSGEGQSAGGGGPGLWRNHGHGGANGLSVSVVVGDAAAFHDEREAAGRSQDEGTGGVVEGEGIKVPLAVHVGGEAE